MKRVLAAVCLILSLCCITVLSPLSFAAQYTLIPQVDLRSYYTDNVFLTEGDTEDDIVTTVIPGITAGVSGRTAGIDVRFFPGYTFYRNNSDRDYWRLNAGLNGFVDITQYTKITLRDDFYLTRDPVPEDRISDVRAQEPDVSLDPTVRQGRDKYWRNTFSARVDHQFGAENTVFAEYRNRLLRNDNNAEYEDSDINTGIAGVTYFFGPKWGVDLEGTFTRRQYDPSGDFIGIPSSDVDLWGGRGRLIRRFSRTLDGFIQYQYANVDYTSGNPISTVPGGGQPTIVLNEDYQVHDVRAGVDYAIERDIFLTVNAGWALKVNDVTDNQDGFVFEAIIRKELERGGFRVEAGAGYDFGTFNATSQNYGFIRYYRAGATGDYQIFRRWYGDAYAFYRRNEYLDTIPEREDDIYRAGAGITWQPVRWGSIRLGYAYRQRESEINTFNYTENRILLNLSLATELPYRALF